MRAGLLDELLFCKFIQDTFSMERIKIMVKQIFWISSPKQTQGKGAKSTLRKQ